MRSVLLDSRVQPVENVVPNPGFERANAGSTIVRRNLHPEPRVPSISNGRWYAVGPYLGGRTISSGSVGPFATGYQIVIQGDTPNNGAGIGTNMREVKARGPVALSMYVYSSVRRVVRVYVERWSAATGGSRGSNYNGPIFTLEPGVTRVGVVVPPSPDFPHYAFGVIGNDTQNLPAGTIFSASGGLYEERPAVLPFFDGATVNDRGVAYSWEGTSNTSTSVARSSVVEVRRNHCVSPFGVGALPAYSGTVNQTITPNVAISDHPEGYLTANRVQYDASAQNPGVGFSPLYMMEVGKTYTMSAWVKVEAQFNSGGYALALAGLEAYPVSVTLGQWVFVSVTTTVSGSFARQAGFRQSASGSGSASLLITGIVVEETTRVNKAFDGNLTVDADLTPAWVNGENSSASVLYGVAVSGPFTTLGVSNHYRTWQGGVRNNSPALRIATSGGNVDNSGITVSFANLGLRAGRRYTALATLVLTGEQMAGGQRARRMNAWNGIADVFSPQSPNVAGVYQHRIFFTTGTALAHPYGIRLYNGTAMGGVDSIWDDFMVVEGEYRGEYIDGDIPGCIWRGNPHDSASVGFPTKLAA